MDAQVILLTIDGVLRRRVEVELRSLVSLLLSIDLHGLHGLLSGRWTKINLDGGF